MPKRKKKTNATDHNDRVIPFLELRVGGVHLTVERAPVGILLVVAALSGSGFTGWLVAQ